MKTLLPLSFAVASSLAAACAFAQDASSAAGDASAKRFAVVGSATVLQPYSDPVKGARLDVDGDVAPTLSASWYATPNIAVELWGAADKFNHRVRGDAGKIGTVDQQPVALSGQYHFGASDRTFRPFVGVGYYESNFSKEDIDGLGDGGHVGLETAKGAIGTVGVDLNISPTWFARADARYLRSRPDLTLNGQSIGEEAKLDPWTVGFGVGARF
ncbi:MAG: OmpW family outer membrane protein [Pseudoxanthomonas sp.]